MQGHQLSLRELDIIELEGDVTDRYHVCDG